VYLPILVFDLSKWMWVAPTGPGLHTGASPKPLMNATYTHIAYIV